MTTYEALTLVLSSLTVLLSLLALLERLFKRK